jgi:hypothetical protein
MPAVLNMSNVATLVLKERTGFIVATPDLQRSASGFISSFPIKGLSTPFRNLRKTFVPKSRRFCPRFWQGISSLFDVSLGKLRLLDGR